MAHLSDVMSTGSWQAAAASSGATRPGQQFRILAIGCGSGPGIIMSVNGQALGSHMAGVTVFGGQPAASYGALAGGLRLPRLDGVRCCTGAVALCPRMGWAVTATA